MAKKRGLKHQFNFAILQCCRYGESKNEYKNSHEGDTGPYIFSIAYTKNIRDTAEHFSKFLKENHPEIKMAIQVNDKHAQEYINANADKWSRKTMENKISQIKKLGLCINNVFDNKKTKSDTFKIQMCSPYHEIHEKVIKGRAAVRNIAMSPEDLLLLKKNMNPQSNAYLCLEITSRCGLRVNEVACLRRENINIDKKLSKLGKVLKETYGEMFQYEIKILTFLKILKTIQSASILQREYTQTLLIMLYDGRCMKWVYLKSIYVQLIMLSVKHIFWNEWTKKRKWEKQN